MLTLNTHIIKLPTVGPKISSRLKKLGLETVSDLLFYFPWRYDNFGAPTKIADLQPGTTANFSGQIDLIQNKRARNRRLTITEALISDDSGSLKITWFNQPFIIKNLKVGDHISLAGKITSNYGQLNIVSPIYEKIKTTDKPLIHTQGLTPIYSSTANLTQKQLRFLIKISLEAAKNLPEWLPENIKKRLNLLNLDQALAKIHFPKNEQDILAAKQRLGFAELFLRQLKSQLSRRELQKTKAPTIDFLKTDTQNFVTSLPFKLTADQKKAAWQILQDLTKNQPMSRLLEGDVGSGKTLVAVLALLNVALNNKQAVLMAPTEILAKQHFATISQLLQNYPIKISLLTRTQKQTNFSELPKIDSQTIITESHLIIGTQALIQDKINLPHLALIIVDEQHRFGVRQRQKLTHNQNLNHLAPHFLSMTATPIPRSLALAIYGDLEISIIKEKPATRKPIITKIISDQERPAAYNFLRDQIKAGRQIFVICPLIDPSDKLGVKSVTTEYEYLDKEIFPDIKIGLLHGKLKSQEKNQIMQDFLEQKTKILVSTSVIEVGIDVPNATIMMIENAQRFGLAQLHQFRGRVGRGSHQSYCFLFSDNNQLIPNDKTKRRLEALVKYQDGFLLAKEDLKLRGAGEIYGTIQSGYPELKIASLFDYELIKKAQIAAQEIINSDPELNKHPYLKAKLGDFENSLHLE